MKKESEDTLHMRELIKTGLPLLVFEVEGFEFYTQVEAFKFCNTNSIYGLAETGMAKPPLFAAIGKSINEKRKADKKRAKYVGNDLGIAIRVLTEIKKLAEAKMALEANLPPDSGAISILDVNGEDDFNEQSSIEDAIDSLGGS